MSTPSFTALLTPAEDSPLNEALPESLEELFSRDPLDLSDQDLDVMIAAYRAKRGVWLKAEVEAKAKPKGRGPKVQVVAPKNLDLSSLGL